MRRRGEEKGREGEEKGVGGEDLEKLQLEKLTFLSEWWQSGGFLDSV